MALLLCLTTLTLLVGSSTASAVESSFDTYEITDDIGIMPLSSNPVFYDKRANVFSVAQLEVIKGFINKLPISQHYAMVYEFQHVGVDYNLLYHVFVFDSSRVSGWELIVDDAYMYDIIFKYDYDLSDGISGSSSPSGWCIVSQPVKVSNLIFNSLAGYSVSYDVNGKNVSKSGLSLIFSDVPNSFFQKITTVDISNRKEVLPQYATVFGLAVFLVLDILRGFWRSARGRDT